MSKPVRYSVVIAIEHSEANLPALLDRLAVHDNSQIEVIVCRAQDGPTSPDHGGRVRWLTAPAGSTIPEMWRDGILAARGEFVALLTGHCVPTPGWLDALVRLQVPSAVAGIGGFFIDPPDASALDRAIYLLRYAAYSRPTSVPSSTDVAADNAVYRRAEILACRDLLPHGFWEPEYHRQFAARGLRLMLEPSLLVEHRNRYTAVQFAKQRRVHGRHFGSDRARRLGVVKRAAYLVATPAVPFVLLAKVVVRARRFGLLKMLRPAVMAWLGFLCANWALGEARGVAQAFDWRTRP